VYIWKLLYDEELKKLTATRVKIVNLERKFAEDSKGKFALVKCVAFHNGRKNLLGELNAMMVVGYSSGVFSIIMLPDFEEVHSLSISNNEISSVAINNSGEWLAFGSPLLGQLLVWEWKSETCKYLIYFSFDF
jgi:periodic tryptophan protein 2